MNVHCLCGPRVFTTTRVLLFATAISVMGLLSTASGQALGCIDPSASHEISTHLVATKAAPEVDVDWPQWLGPRGDSIWRTNDLMQEFPEGGPPVVWRTEINGGYSSPAVADGRLFVMDRIAYPRDENAPPGQGLPGNERVLCFNADSGELIWEHTYDSTYRIGYGAGPRAMPTVDEDRVYTYGAMGDLYCLKVSDGSVVWHVNVLEKFGATVPVWGYASNPVVDGPRLFVNVGGENSTIVVLDKLTGETKWTALTAQEIGLAPTVFAEHNGKRVAIVWYDEAVVGFEPESGEQLWTVPFPGYAPQRPAVAIMTPRVYEDKLLISNFYDGMSLFQLSFDPPGAETLWTSVGKDRRHENDLNTVMTPAIIRDGHIYGLAGNGEIRCLDLQSGELRWRNYEALALEGQDTDKAPGRFDGFPALFKVVVDDQSHDERDRYLLFTDQGMLILARLNPEGYHEIDRAQVLKPSAETRGREYVWCHPAFSGSRLFVRNEKELICIDLRRQQM